MGLINCEEVIKMIKKIIEIDFKKINDLILKLKPENDDKIFERSIFDIYRAINNLEIFQYIKKIFPNFQENDNLNKMKNEKDKENYKILSLDNINLNKEIKIKEENVGKINISKINLANEKSDSSNKIITEKGNFNIVNDKSFNYSFKNFDNINYQNLNSRNR